MNNQSAQPNPVKTMTSSIRLLFSSLALALTGSALVAAPAITNPSFEANTYTVFPGYHHQEGNGAITGWTPTGGAGLNPAAGSPFADNGVIPNGAQVAFIQNGADSALSTVIPDLTVGQSYKVNFRVNARSGNTPNLKIDVGGVNILNTAITPVGASNPYKYFAFDFTASAASQTLTLRNDAGGDNTVVIDDFSIAPRNSGWSYAAWTDDATAGVDSTKNYTHAYNFGSAAATTINGIAFTGVGGPNPSVAGSFSTAGLPNVLNNDGNALAGGSRQLANDFIYGGDPRNPQSLTISGLIPGERYMATIYSVGWENGTRGATFSVGDDRLTVNQDHFGDNNGLRVSYRYTATASSITLTYVPLQDATFHTYGFNNFEVGPPQVVNPSFEADTFTVFPGYVNGNPPGITGWNALGGHGVNPGTFGGPFTDNGTIPDGTKAAFLQEAGPLTQVINDLNVGVAYQVRFFENARNCCSGGPPTLEVRIGSSAGSGGTIIVAAHAVPPVLESNPYRQVISDAFVASASSLELAFIKGNAAGEDNTLLIDNVSILPPNSPPSITGEPQDLVLGLGEPAVFSVRAGGSPPLAFQWYFGGAPIPGAIDSTLTVATDSPAAAGDYFVIVSNGAGSATSRTAKLTLRAKVAGLFNSGVDANGVALADGAVDPHWTLVTNADGPSTDAIVHDSTVFPIVAGPWFANNAGSKWIGPRFDTAGAAGLAQGNGTYVYRTTFSLSGIDLPSLTITGEWGVDNNGVAIRVNGAPTGLVNGNGFATLTAFTLFSQNATFVDGLNTIEFEVQNVDAVSGYTGIRIANLRGLALLPGTPPSIVTQPQSRLAAVGESASFNVVAGGSSPLSYQWRKDGFDLAGQTSPTLSLSSLTSNDEGVYSVRISNTGGTILSDEATLTVLTVVPARLYSTGVDDSGAALADGAVDPHYRLVLNADSASNDAIVENSLLFPIVGGPWVPNTPDSKWIGPRLDTAGAAAGDYAYRTSFDMTGFDPATARVIGEWATDNDGQDIVINGTSTGLKNTVQFVGYTAFSITSGLTSGVNQIEFKLNNAGPAVGWTGLRVRNIRVLFRPPNTCPQAHPQAVTVNEDSSTPIVLGTRDVDGDPLTYTIITPPSHGTLSGTAPNLTYTPARDYCGADSFTFKANDGQCDSAAAQVSINVTCANDNPIARIAITPLVDLGTPSATLFVLSINGSNACVTLDGSASSDAEPGPLSFEWFLDGAVPLASGAIASACLELGLHQVDLAVSDGDGGTGTASAAVEVITGSEAVDELIEQVNDSDLGRKNKRPLIATLKAVSASFDRGSIESALGQLHAFENKVRAQVGPIDPALATEWIRIAQSIANAAIAQQ